MKRILFVDDEANVLDGLRRSLRPMREEWQMEFVCGAAQALAAFENEPFDVVVSDMRMPEMDGADLLAELMRRHPSSIRIILSGHSDHAAIMKSVGVTHQYLAKPCDSELLKRTINRATALKRLVDSDTVRHAVSGIKNLPALPSLYKQLVECLGSGDASPAKVAQIISRDVGMTARVLQLVNSAFFGLPKTVASVDRAVSLLGLDTITHLVLAYGAFSSYEDAATGFDVDALTRDSLRCAALAKTIAQCEKRPKEIADQAFLAGMLHDVGKLVLAVELPGRYADYLALTSGATIDVPEIELEVFGATHAHVGAYLVGLWGLPNPIVEGIAYHESPSACIDPELGVFGIVHVASRLARAPGADDIADPALSVDLDHLSRAGALARWPAWREAIRNHADTETAA